MSSYHTSFTYLGKNSYDDFNLQIMHFENGDVGETDSYMSQESIYTDSPRGTKRMLYGTKYSDVAKLDITVMKPNGDEFGIEKTREIYKWLTGATQYSWMDLYIGDEVKYRMLCFAQNVRPYKIDSRIVGFIITMESSSPWCFSPVQQSNLMLLTGEETLEIQNPSDDMYTFTPMNIVFKNTEGNSLVISNNTLDETTQINNLAVNETVTLSDNLMITSDKTTRVFGNDFNYVWPRLKSGNNNFTIIGKGEFVYQYIYCIKVGDCIGDLNASSDPVCSEDGTIILDKLPWSRISNTPTTLDGYGISNAYTKTEVDQKIATEIDNKLADLDITGQVSLSWENIINKPTTAAGYELSDVYTKTEVDQRLKNISSSGDGTQIDTISWYKILDTPTTIAGYGMTDAYTKTEIDKKFENITAVDIDISEEDLNAMLEEVLN